MVQDYLTAADPANGNPGFYISDKFNVALGQFEFCQPHFQFPGYEVLLLTDFAQYANLYLGLLRDGILYGKTWGWADSAVQELQTTMTKFLDPAGPTEDSFVSYVSHWYEYGKAQVKVPTSGAHLNVRNSTPKQICPDDDARRPRLRQRPGPTWIPPNIPTRSRSS